MDYIDKIRKLFALADNPNEEEAKAALLKARKLMAEHKLTDRDIKDVGGEELVTLESKYTCTSIRDSWLLKLSGVIAYNYCCSARSYKEWNKKTRYVHFVGFDDDVHVCLEVFEYAVGFIHNEFARIKNDLDSYYRKDLRTLCNSYAYGFCAGLKNMYQRQSEEIQNEYGLVPVMSDVLKEDNAKFPKSNFYQKYDIEFDRYSTEYSDGFYDGTNFTANRVLTAVN